MGVGKWKVNLASFFNESCGYHECLRSRREKKNLGDLTKGSIVITAYHVFFKP